MHRMSECFRSRALRSRQLDGHHVDVINRVCALLNQLPLTGQPSSNHEPQSSKKGVVGSSSATSLGQGLGTQGQGLGTQGQGLHSPHQPLPTILREMLECCRQSLSIDQLVPLPTPAPTSAAVVTQRDHDDDSSMDQHPMTAAVTAMGLQCVVRQISLTQLSPYPRPNLNHNLNLILTFNPFNLNPTYLF